jgi:molybdopterin converting factor small subunit
MTATSVPDTHASNTAADAALPSGVIRYWAAAREAAGTDSEPFVASTLADALAHAVDARGGAAAGGGALAHVLARCSIVIDGDPVGTRDHANVKLAEGAVVEVLPPFAGG